MMKRLILALLLCGLAGAWAADELSLSIGWTYDMNGRKRVLSPTTSKFTIATNAVVENVQEFSTNAAAALVLGGVTSCGFAYFKNLDTNDYIEIGCMDVNTNFVAFLRLEALQTATAWLATSAPYAWPAHDTTNRATVKLDYVISNR